MQQARTVLTPDSAKLIIVLVGLPARGKSLLGHKLEQFLSWRGYKTRAFRVGSRRREMSNGLDERPETGAASFFDSKKAYAAMVREKVSLEVYDELLEWLLNDGQVAIFDASNVSIQRRAKLKEKAHQRGGSDGQIGVVFVESIVTDPNVIQEQMGWKVAHSADFKTLGQEAALADLRERITHYEQSYETVRKEEGAYIKLFNLSATAHCSNIYGRMSKSVLPFLLALHSVPRSVFLVIVSESDVRDASALAAFQRWMRQCGEARGVRVICSTQPRAMEMATALAEVAGAEAPAERAQLAPLTRQRPSTEEVGQSFRNTFGERIANLVARLEPIALEIEASTQPVLVVAHEAPVRTLRSYLLKPTSPTISERETVDSTFEASINHVLEYFPHPEGGMGERVHDVGAVAIA